MDEYNDAFYTESDIQAGQESDLGDTENGDLVQPFTGADFSSSVSNDLAFSDPSAETVNISDESIALLASAVSTNPYQGTISDSYLDYFAGIAGQRFDDYVIFRETQYNYVMYMGDLEKSDSWVITGDDLETVRIARNGSDYNYYVYHGYGESLNLNASSGFVYGDLEGLSDIVGVSNAKFETLSLGLAVAFVFVLVGGFFRHIYSSFK